MLYHNQSCCFLFVTYDKYVKETSITLWNVIIWSPTNEIKMCIEWWYGFQHNANGNRINVQQESSLIMTLSSDSDGKPYQKLVAKKAFC